MYVTCARSKSTRPTIDGWRSSNRVASVKSPLSTTRVRAASLMISHWVRRASTWRPRSSRSSNAAPTTLWPSWTCDHTARALIRTGSARSGATVTVTIWPSTTGSGTINRAPSIDRFETRAAVGDLAHLIGRQPLAGDEHDLAAGARGLDRARDVVARGAVELGVEHGERGLLLGEQRGGLVAARGDHELGVEAAEGRSREVPQELAVVRDQDLRHGVRSYQRQARSRTIRVIRNTTAPPIVASPRISDALS